jgi:hypothetical protein
MTIGVTDAAAALLRAWLQDNPALPGRLVRVVAAEGGGLGLVVTDAPGDGDVELRPGLVAERAVAERAGGCRLDRDAAGGGLALRRADGRPAPAGSRRHAPA